VLDVRLTDGTGSSNGVKVSEDGTLNVVVHPHPPKDDVRSTIPLRQYLSLDGLGAVTDMRVDGSTTEQVFSIKATGDMDTYVASLSIVIADAGADLNQFGNIGVLSNGFELRWVTQDKGTVVIADSLTTNFEFIRLAGGVPAFGTGTNAFRANNVSGNSEGYIPFLDFREIFGIQWGLKLRKGTNDRLELVVKDNVTGVDQYDCISYGIRF